MINTLEVKAGIMLKDQWRENHQCCTLVWDDAFNGKTNSENTESCDFWDVMPLQQTTVNKTKREEVSKIKQPA